MQETRLKMKMVSNCGASSRRPAAKIVAIYTFSQFLAFAYLNYALIMLRIRRRTAKRMIRLAPTTTQKDFSFAIIVVEFTILVPGSSSYGIEFAVSTAAPGIYTRSCRGASL